MPVDPTGQEPSLFRQLLGGALLGLAGAGNRPSDQTGSGDFVAGFGGGVERVEGQRQQQRVAGQENRAEQRQQEQQQMQQESQQSEREFRRIQMAHMQVQGKMLERQIAQMPADHQEAMLDELRKGTQDMIAQGVPIAFEGEDYATVEQERMRLLKQDKDADGQLNFSYITRPHPTDKGKFVVMQAPINRMTTSPMKKKLGEKTIDIPVGTPMEEVFKIDMKSAELSAETHIAEIKARDNDAEIQKSKIKFDALQATVRDVDTTVSSLYKQIDQVNDALGMGPEGAEKAALLQQREQIQARVQTEEARRQDLLHNVETFNAGLGFKAPPPTEVKPKKIVMMKHPTTGDIGPVPEDKVEDAKAAGYEVVAERRPSKFKE